MFNRKMERTITTMNEDRIARLYGDCVRFHGHDCPLLALGVRVCETALDRLKLEDPALGRLVCVSEFDGCCVDAIQIGLHCTAGAKHLLYYKTGKLIFTVYDLETGTDVRICARKEIAEDIRQMEPEAVLAAPEDALFTFEKAHPLTPRTLAKVRRTCTTPAPSVPHRISGVQDCPDQFRKFDSQN